MIAYGSELALKSPNAVRRTALRYFGTYDLGARVRFAAVRKAVRHLPEPSSVLDVGCGLGLLCFALTKMWPRASIVGTEIDMERLRDARELARLHGLSNRVRFERVEDHDPAQRYDVVTCVDVLEHVDDDVAFAEQLFASTNAGGTLVLHVPAAVKRRFFRDFPEQHDHVRCGYDPAEVVRLLQTAGFVQTEVRFTFGALGAIGWEGFALARQGSIIARGLLPLWYASAAADSAYAPARGNGLLVTARRSA